MAKSEVTIVKKVRFAIGAAGLAPAIGLLMPAANAAATTAHTPKKAVKKVSVQHINGRVRPDACGTEHHVSVQGRLRELVDYSTGGGGCINSVHGILSLDRTGLEMRTRVYTVAGGSRVFQNYVHGNAFFTGTSFNTAVNKHGSQVCIALVQSTHHSKVNFGPVCVSSL
jgi:hypothetical protein